MKRIGILSKNYIINVSCLLAVVTLSGILKYYVIMSMSYMDSFSKF